MKRSLSLLVASVACVACSSTHPLDRDGTVAVDGDAPGPLFMASADTTSANHQRTSQNVTIALTEAGQPAKNAFVDVQVSPGTALTLRSTDGTCGDNGGYFRCTGNAQGLARFVVDTTSTWSSPTPAVVQVVWSDRVAELPVTVLPAGLPKTTTSFTLNVGGLASGQQQRVPATYSLLQCGSQPLDPGATWPDKPRQRQLVVRAVAPAGDPTSIASAPVRLESSSTEVEFATAADCKLRSPTLTVNLDDTGNASAYACFSALGGLVTISASSGELGVTDGSHKTLQLDAEPRFLSVTAVNPQAHVNAPLNLFQLVARDVLAQRVPISVSVTMSGTGEVQLSQSTYTLADESAQQPTLVNVLPIATGTVHLHVTPDLVSTQSCDSPDVQILP